MLHEININKESVNFYLKQEDTFNEDTIMREIAMDIAVLQVWFVDNDIKWLK